MNNGKLFEVMDDSFPVGLVRFKGTVLRGHPHVYYSLIDQFEVRNDDVWLFGFMRSGTNWAKEMIWRIANDLNFENTELARERFPTFDVIMMRFKDDVTPNYDSLSKLNSLPSTRFLKSHLPFHLLPRQLRNGEKKPKMIYIARNPKDVCVSFYYFQKHFYNFKGSLAEMSELFITDKVTYAPYWDNVFSYWQKRKEFDILFLKYEDMKNDLPSVIRKTAKFFEKNLTDEQVTALSLYLSFENYSKNPALTNEDFDEKYKKRYNHKDSKGFVRKGTVDQWKQEMSPEIIRRFDEWIEKNLKNSDYNI